MKEDAEVIAKLVEHFLKLWSTNPDNLHPQYASTGKAELNFYLGKWRLEIKAEVGEIHFTVTPLGGVTPWWNMGLNQATG